MITDTANMGRIK